MASTGAHDPRKISFIIPSLNSGANSQYGGKAQIMNVVTMCCMLTSRQGYFENLRNRINML